MKARRTRSSASRWRDARPVRSALLAPVAFQGVDRRKFEELARFCVRVIGGVAAARPSLLLGTSYESLGRTSVGRSFPPRAEAGFSPRSTALGLSPDPRGQWASRLLGSNKYSDTLATERVTATQPLVGYEWGTQHPAGAPSSPLQRLRLRRRVRRPIRRIACKCTENSSNNGGGGIRTLVRGKPPETVFEYAAR